MVEKLAIKRLTASDLTFFEHHYQVSQSGHQKSINLNRAVFIDEMYPSLPARVDSAQDDRIHVTLKLFGPGSAPEIRMNKQIIKGRAYKNWRLNGAFVRTRDVGDRFNTLEPGDLAVLCFVGDLEPGEVRIDFLARANPDDAWLHSAFEEELDKSRMSGGMCSLPPSVYDRVIADDNCPEAHPIRRLGLTSLIETVALGASESQVMEGRPKLSKGQLAVALARLKEIGDEGETLINEWLDGQKRQGWVVDFDWVSATDALAPFDFSLVVAEGEVVCLEVKATTGEFGRGLHLSLAEATKAAEDRPRYDVYRLYDLEGRRAKLRVLEGFGGYAKKLLGGVGLPQGARVEGFILNPEELEFGPEIRIELADPGFLDFPE